MKKIIVGCPYTGMENLERAFVDIKYNELLIVNTAQVDCIASDGVWVGDDFHHTTEFSASFIRYPYDLIPPHSQTYQLREEIEYYKSLALLFDSVALNRLSSTWRLRNRSYSLSQARAHGVNVADFRLIRRGSNAHWPNETVAVKAIGNCFVSIGIEDLNQGQREYLSIEEDDGDIAAVFPASEMSADVAKDYLQKFGHAFLQDVINSVAEYRCYVIGERLFTFKRCEVDGFDKSFAAYEPSDYKLQDSVRQGLLYLCYAHGLKYLCFDMVVDVAGVETVIDINPYGSMPDYQMFPEVSICLANELAERVPGQE